ncbi:MAG: carboxypeptidase regulatory-like domain-containing protein, partial [Longimicrobiales bacterium]
MSKRGRGVRIIPLLVFVVGAAAAAQQLDAQRVHGVVTDDASNARLTGVALTLIDDRDWAGAAATTDSLGAFDLRAPRSGAYRLRVELIGYVSFTSERLELASSEAVQVTVRLANRAVPVSPVVVVGRRMSGRLADFERRRANHASGYFMTRDDIDKRAIAKPTTLLMGVPGVRLQALGRRGSTPDDRNVVQFTGSGARPCTANVFIDGVPAPQTPVTIDEILDVSMLGAVEIYSRAGSAPAEYQRGNTCGVVLFWTREHERGGRWSWTKTAIAVGLVVTAV